MIYDILEGANGVNTKGLGEIMKLITYKYKNRITSPVDWDFETFDEDSMIEI